MIKEKKNTTEQLSNSSEFIQLTPKSLPNTGCVKCVLGQAIAHWECYVCYRLCVVDVGGYNKWGRVNYC